MERNKFRDMAKFFVEGFIFNYPNVKPFKIRTTLTLNSYGVDHDAYWDYDDRTLFIKYNLKLSSFDLLYLLLHEFIHILLDEETDYYNINSRLIINLPIKECEKGILNEWLCHDKRFYDKWDYVSKNLKSRFD